MRILTANKMLLLILGFAALSRLYRLDYPDQYVFDEVYHAFTAKEYLKGSKEAWEWWTTAPPGVAFEWTHPPLAKEIMTASMVATGSTDAWAWRLPGAVLGVMSVLLVYQLGALLFQNWVVGALSALVYAIDGLNFVQSRTGMNDIYLVTFTLASLLFFLRGTLGPTRNRALFVLSAVFLGLALASKWSGAYLFPVYLLLLLKHRLGSKVAYFVALPPFVYLASYLPFFLTGHTPQQFIDLQQRMWSYHTTLSASHDYASLWWSWPLNLYPVWYFVEYQGDNIANIFASGNPAVFAGGVVALALTAWSAFRKRTAGLAIILLGYGAFWLPWALSSRITFLYHYSPAIPFLSLALGYQLSLLSPNKNGRILLAAIVGLMLVGFFIMYPFLTGVPLPKNAVNVFFFTNLAKNPFN